MLFNGVESAWVFRVGPFSLMNRMSYSECFSVSISTIYCFNHKLRLFFVRNWVIPYVNENAGIEKNEGLQTKPKLLN